MKEVELLRKLHGTFDRLCHTCETVKHISRFKRFNTHYKLCNDCFLKSKGELDDDATNKDEVEYDK